MSNNTFEEAVMQQRDSKAKNNNASESPIAVIAAIIGNILIGIVKFIAAGISGSSAMVSEGIHSIVDSGDGLLVLYGLRASRKKPDIEHPFGYGKELYFYTFIVAILIFALGGGVSIFKGITAWMTADTIVIGDPTLNYAVCIIALIIEGSSLAIAIRSINKDRGNMGLVDYVKTCKDPSNFVILFEDSAAESGLIVAILGVFLTHQTGNPRFDAAASIIIGLILIVVAVLLLKETKGLLIGEGLSPYEIEDIVHIVENDKCVNRCGQVLSMYMGPQDMILTLDVNFKGDASEVEVLRSIDRIEHNIIKKYPEAKRIFIEVESFHSVQLQKKKREELIEEAEAELEE